MDLFYLSLAKNLYIKMFPKRYTASLAVPIWGAYSADLCEAAIMSAESPSGMGSLREKLGSADGYLEWSGVTEMALRAPLSKGGSVAEVVIGI